MMRSWIAVVVVVTAFGAWAPCFGAAPAQIKHESFDRDPHWEGWNNWIVPAHAPLITQDFGPSDAHHATDKGTELGGQVQRSTRPAYYALTLAPRTLNEPFKASGTFAITASSPSSGVFFGLFNADQPGGGGRAVNSVGLDLDGERHGARLAVRMINANNQSCGTFITPFIPGKYRPTPIRNDGTRYHWTLQYDPAANAGTGRLTIVVDSTHPNSDDTFEGKTFTVDLPPGFRKTNATFDRFGLLDAMKTGGAMSIYFADLALDDKPLDPGDAAAWAGHDNRAHYPEASVVGAHQFGFSEKTNFAGGAPGEVGGDLWRSGKYAYYADPVGPFSLDQPLHAAGRVVLKVGAPDSDMYIGFFGSQTKDKPPAKSGNFVGVHVGGPTRVGHYFAPAYATARGTTGHVKSGPVLVPGKPMTWSLDYDPAAGQGRGVITVKLGDESVALPLARDARAQGARLDRFGLFTSDIGGQLVRIYFDDLDYTATPGPAP
jgi:hypothetical protein